MIVDIDTVGRLQEHEVRHGAHDGTMSRLRPTPARALHQQQRDQPGLEHHEHAETKDLQSVQLPGARLPEEDPATGRQPALADTPAVQLTPVECRHARRLLERNVLGSRPRKNLKRGEALRVVYHAADDAGPDIRVGADVNRNRGGLGQHFHDIRWKPDTARILLRVADVVNQRTRGSGFDSCKQARQRPLSDVVKFYPPLQRAQ